MEKSYWEIIWTDYMQYRAKLRGFDLNQIEHIIRYTGERYIDVASGRVVAIGRHNDVLVMIPYEIEGEMLIPVTVHATTRQQINLRLKTGRLVYE
ncbi:MAG: hypothetical protein JXA33_16975 [Anaerolineae bacterium]|nr:hypothetical protein [Anaerolineae bacterium]